MSTERIIDVQTVSGNDVKIDNGNPVGATANTNATQTNAAKNTLFRHPTDKLVGGVCGGLADYFGFDPTLVRILWVVMTLVTSGGGFLAYLALWLLLPVGTQTFIGTACSNTF